MCLVPYGSRCIRIHSSPFGISCSSCSWPKIPGGRFCKLHTKKKREEGYSLDELRAPKPDKPLAVDAAPTEGEEEKGEEEPTEKRARDAVTQSSARARR